MIFKVNQTTRSMTAKTGLPVHVAVIPDGNRRWARKNNLPELEGHRIASEKTLPKLIETAAKMGVKYFTFWALSTENAKRRSPEEQKNLMHLMRLFLRSKVNEFKKNNIKLQIIGNITELPQDVQDLMAAAIAKTSDCTGMTVIFAINYGGRDEIVRAVRRLMMEKHDTDAVSQDLLKQYLDTNDVPDPDLVVRTGGEQRLSGFMLWQSEYAEYRFSDKFFPEFSIDDWQECLTSFAQAERRYGK